MTHLVFSLIIDGGYCGVALLMALENICPPIPSELVLGLGGIAVAHGHMAYLPLLLASTIGTTLGTSFWYVLGRFVGKQRLKPIVDRWSRWLTLEWQDIERLSDFFARHGGWVVFVFRFMPTCRTPISLPAGLLHMKAPRFLLWTAAGAAVWNSLLIGAGYWLGTSFHHLEAFIGPASIGIVALIVAGYLWRVITWQPRHARG